MKTQNFIFLFVVCCALMTGCTKDNMLGDDTTGINLKKASKSAVFMVEVEPTGIDDTENLKNAFADAMAAGPGAAVQLTEGEFFIDLIEVKEFHGTLKGAGKGKTVISTIADLSVDDFLSLNLKTVLLKFVGGDVCVRDLTIKTPEGNLSTGSKSWIHGQLSFCSVTAQYIAENEYVNAIVDNVEFITQGKVRNGLLAESDFFTGVPEGVPLTDIDISVTNCSFSGPYWWYGALLMEIREGNIVAGSKSKGNIFDNCVLGIWHNVSVKINVHSNTFISQGKWFVLEILSSPYSSLLQQMPQTFASVCNVEKNIFEVSNSTGAILINDNRRILFPEESPMLVQVKNNKLHTEGGMKTAMACLNTNGTVIRNNKFTGEAEFGLRIFPQVAEIYSDNGLILGNNFSNSEYSVTTVLLGEGTRNWTIVGGNLGEAVADFGENNIITGFNNNTSEVPVGQTIVDNLEEMRKALKNIDDY